MFLKNMLLAGEQVIILYLIAAVGFVADKVGFFPEKTAKKCTDLLFYIVTPAVIVQSFLNLEYSRETIKGLFLALGCGFLLHGLAVVTAPLIFNRCPDKGKAAIFKYASCYGNCGYMGLPLSQALFGDEGVFYCSAVVISFQIFSFTHGIYVMTKGMEEKQKFDIKKLLLNPGILSVAIGMPLFLLDINMPNMISAPIGYVASLNSPLAMLIFGTYIANTSFKTIFKEWRIGCVAIVKLIVTPVILLLLFKLFGIGGALLGSVMVPASAPSASNTALFAAKYGRDTGLASQTVAVVSFLSILTMPVMIAVSQMA